MSLIEFTFYALLCIFFFLTGNLTYPFLPLLSPLLINVIFIHIYVYTFARGASCYGTVGSRWVIGYATSGFGFLGASASVADGSFVETTSGPAARELKRRYDQFHGVNKDLRSPYIITAIINQHGKQVYRVGLVRFSLSLCSRFITLYIFFANQYFLIYHCFIYHPILTRNYFLVKLI